MWPATCCSVNYKVILPQIHNTIQPEDTLCIYLFDHAETTCGACYTALPVQDLRECNRAELEFDGDNGVRPAAARLRSLAPESRAKTKQD